MIYKSHYFIIKGKYDNNKFLNLVKYQKRKKMQI